jgi:hypothetical protein
MCFRDVLDALRAAGLNINGTQLRWAINSGKIDRPRLDGSLRFDYEPQQVDELREYFRRRKVRRQPGHAE